MLNDTTTSITDEAFGATINIPSTTLISTPSSSNSTVTKIITHEKEFICPERDIRSYRYIQLSNQLQCLLVCSHMSNDTIGIEAASVHVQAGHFDDTIPGLARRYSCSFFCNLFVCCVFYSYYSEREKGLLSCFRFLYRFLKLNLIILFRSLFIFFKKLHF